MSESDKNTNTKTSDNQESKYKKPSVTVDILLFTIMVNQLNVLLVERKYDPFKSMWAIPGGFVNIDESLSDAARRELYEETNLNDLYLEQLYTFGKPDRDPRTRVITVAYYSLAPYDTLKQARAGSDASNVKWVSVKRIEKLAFDHNVILDYALERIRTKSEYSTLPFRLLPTEFTLTELQNVYEIILDRELDKRNFRKKIISLDILKETNTYKKEGKMRPAMIYRLKDKNMFLLKEKGIVFPF
jgi:8-oxo-dGTP diphosphatase